MAKCTGRVPIRDADGRHQRDSNGDTLTRPCGRGAIAGGTVCPSHGGNAKQVKAKAAVRAEVMSWGLGDAAIDPGETLLRLVSQSAARAQRYSVELEQFVDRHGSIEAAMIGESLMIDKSGEPVKIGEYVRGLATLEAQERDRCATFAAKAVAAGLAERQVKLAERQGELIVQVLTAVFADLGLSEEQLEVAPDVIRRHLTLVAS